MLKLIAGLFFLALTATPQAEEPGGTSSRIGIRRTVEGVRWSTFDAIAQDFVTRSPRRA